MSCLSNDLATWANKARLQGYNIEITPKLAYALCGVLDTATFVAQSSITDHDGTVAALRHALLEAEKVR